MMFEVGDIVRKLHLSNKLHTLKMEEGSQMIMFLKFINNSKLNLQQWQKNGRCSIDPKHVNCTIAKLRGLHSNHHHSRCAIKL
jgi:hypothetical protein